MISFKTYLKSNQSLLGEASVLDPKYGEGQKFMVKSSPTFAKQLQTGDVITVVKNKSGAADFGSGEYEKTFQLPDGKLVKVASSNSGYASSNFNHLKGEKIVPKGEDWESLIVVAYNNKKSGPEWDRAQKFWAEYESQAKTLVKQFKKVIKSSNLSQLGSSTAKLNPNWGGKDNTPKTDIIGNSNEKISLKKAGGSQLMSAGAAETISTFNAAMKIVGRSKPKLLTEFVDTLEEKMGKLNGGGTISAIEKIKKDGAKLTPQQKAAIAEMDKLQLNAKEINADMNKLFSHEYFKTAFCYEAATGAHKFIEQNAIANLLIEFDPDKGIITKDMKIVEIEDAAPLAKTNKFYVSFKTSSNKPYLALRSSQLSKKEMLGLKESFSFKDIVFTEMNNSKFGLQMLSEANDMQQLDEFALFNNLVNKVKNISADIKTAAKNILDKIMAKVKQAFDAIKQLGEKMFNAILHFLGMEVSSVRIRSSGSFPLVN